MGYTSSFLVGFPYTLLRNGILLDTTTPLVCTISSTNTIGNPKVSQIYGFITSPKFGKFVSRFVGNWESPRFPKPDDLIIIFLSFLTSTALNFMM